MDLALCWAAVTWTSCEKDSFLCGSHPPIALSPSWITEESLPITPAVAAAAAAAAAVMSAADNRILSRAASSDSLSSFILTVRKTWALRSGPTGREF